MEHKFMDVSGDGSMFVAVVPQDNIKPIDNRTVELGMRTDIIAGIYLDISAFHMTQFDVIGLDGDAGSKAPVASQIGNHSILPMYFTNIFEGDMFGGEGVAKYTVNKNIRGEISYAYLSRKRYGLPVPGDTSGATYHAPSHDDAPGTPKHIFRFRPYLDLPQYGLYVSAHMLWASEARRGEGYDYLLQRPFTDDGRLPAEPSTTFKMNVSVDKQFMGKQLSLLLWGRNILADDYVEFYSPYVAGGYPHTVHKTFGCSAAYRFF
jgi:hypothetical protein